MATWHTWAEAIRATYAIDETRERLVQLVVETGQRYEQARAALDRDGFTLPDGRVHPAIGVERDSRQAVAKLIAQLGLEDDSADGEAQATDHGRRWPRPA